MPTDKNTFTAAQIAAGLGISARAAYKALVGIPRQGEKLIRGKQVSAWAILQLPQTWITQLDSRAEANGFGNAEQYLSTLNELPAAPDRKGAHVIPPYAIEEIPGVRAIVERPRESDNLSLYDREAIWTLAIIEYHRKVADGVSAIRASKQIRDSLFRYAPKLTTTRACLLNIFKGKLEGTTDGRKNNGNYYRPPESDITRLQHSAIFKNGNRYDAAWQEEYPLLSDYTRNRYPLSMMMPDAVRVAVCREQTEGIADSFHGKLKSKARIGTITRKNDIPSMHKWVLDDLTATIECIYEEDGEASLIQPQIVAVMDTRSRKFVGWAVSPEKAPTADLCCEAFENAITRCGEVPTVIGVENGFVFGRSLEINGKVDERGQTIVSGLARYGCAVEHFRPGNPQSKGELEKGFDLLQRRFERHKGYAGRIQMFHASDKFKRQKREINRFKVKSEKLESAKKSRYTYPQVLLAFDQCFREYNSIVRESLNGLSPDEAFEHHRDKKNPPTKLTPELRWLLLPSRRIVRVMTGGVSFDYFKRKIVVRGEWLLRFPVGTELRAVIKREAPDLVTFMTKDYSETHTMEICEEVSTDEKRMEPGSGVLASEQRKLGMHIKAAKDAGNRLLDFYGDPQQQRFEEIQREDAQRIPSVADPAMVQAHVTMERQRAEIEAHRKEHGKKVARARKLNSDLGMVLSDKAVENLGPNSGKHLRAFLKKYPKKERTP